MAVAECVGLVDGDACRVAGRVDAPFADVVELAPESEPDWLELLECAEDVEANLLTQCGCVVEGAPFPFWPGGGSAGQNGRFGSAGGGDTAGGKINEPPPRMPAFGWHMPYDYLPRHLAYILRALVERPAARRRFGRGRRPPR